MAEMTDERRSIEIDDNDLPLAMVIGRLKRDLVAARERIAELEKDRDRLDWLERKGVATRDSSTPEDPGIHCWRDRQDVDWKWTAHYISSEYNSAREAIDAAIAATKPKEPK
jgi:hypothetical protein